MLNFNPWKFYSIWICSLLWLTSNFCHDFSWATEANILCRNNLVSSNTITMCLIPLQQQHHNVACTCIDDIVSVRMSVLIVCLWLQWAQPLFFFVVVMLECCALYQIPALFLFSKEKTIQMWKDWKDTLFWFYPFSVKISNVTMQWRETYRCKQRSEIFYFRSIFNRHVFCNEKRIILQEKL